MFAVKRDVSKEVGALVSATSGRERGELVTYDEIKQLTGFTRADAPFVTVVRKWGNEIRKMRGIVPVNVPSVGYRFPLAGEQLTNVADRRMKSAMRNVRKAAAAMGSIVDDELTDDQRSYRHATLSNMTNLVELNKKHSAQQQSWLASPKTIPRLPSK